jgi:hypothetical protein
MASLTRVARPALSRLALSCRRGLRFVDVFFNARDEFEEVLCFRGHALDLVEEFDEVEDRVEGTEGCVEHWDYWLRHFDDAW